MVPGEARGPDAAIPEVIPAGWDPGSADGSGRAVAADQQVTAILRGNDDKALAVRRALHEAGRDVPGDVSIVRRALHEAGRGVPGDVSIVRRALHEAGRDVPGDVSIVGRGDVPGAAYGKRCRLSATPYQHARR
ncbi:hypothetical protein [Actinoplanes sp. NPDC020271]|uniref:hypothetical protein n=1 Tax=Actinoplanes sp. NPDC020271 TaxID=3363896 RepID=UPI0037B4C074